MYRNSLEICAYLKLSVIEVALIVNMNKFYLLQLTENKGHNRVSWH